MLNHLDNLIRHLLMKEVPSLRTPNPSTGQYYPVEEKQVGFRPPDENWRSYVSSLTVDSDAANAINVYLIDLRENRKLRSNEKTRNYQNGDIIETPVPQRVDFHYLITAWTPAIINPATDPTVDDEYIKLHLLKYEVIAALMKNVPFVPRKIYDPDPLPVNFPDIIADAELPTIILPVEGFSKLAEFWGTMGSNHHWIPTIYIIITLPVLVDAQIAGPMVTTRITEYRIGGMSDTAEVWIQIGGTVTDSNGEPVGGALIRLETISGEVVQKTYTKEKIDENGRFIFAKIKEGTYKLRVCATGFAEKIKTIEVPSTIDNYDVKLT